MNVSTATRQPQVISFYNRKQANQPLDPNHIGRVKFFDTKKGYGYISTDFGKDVYFHATKVCSASLEAGDKVCFHLNASERYPNRFEAKNLRNVYCSQDGQPIFNRLGSHLHVGVEPILGKIASQIDCQDRPFIEQEISFNEVIGDNICVRLNSDDNVIYGVRKNRSGYTKFVLNRKPEKCRTAVIVLKKVNEGYLIVTCFIGRLAVPEPWDKCATADSWSFWDNHALIYGNEDVYEDTYTDVCPWTLNMAA